MNKTFKKIIHALIPTAILAILAVVVVVLSQPVERVEAQDTSPAKLTPSGGIAPLTPTPAKLTPSGKIAPLTPATGKTAASAGSNTLTIDNQSGKVLYISVERDDGLWLDFTTNQWGTTTLGNDNIHEITGSSDSISLIDTETHAARGYVFTFRPTGKPSLTSNQIWDFFEYTTNAVWDITSVDAVGMPMALEYKTRKAGYRNIPRDFIMGKFANLPSPFNSPGAIIKDGSTIVRALAPQHYLPSSTTVLDKAMKLGFPKWNNLGSASIKSGPWTFTDFSWDAGSDPPRTGTLSFKANGTAFTIGGGTGKSAFTSINVISTAMTEANNAAGRFTALIETAINRGVLDNPRLWGQNDETFGGIAGFPWNYYQDIESRNVKQYNRYSKTVHQWSINGMNYGLAHDDLYNRSSSITVPPGEPAILHIWKFTGGGGSAPITWPNKHYLTTLGIPSVVICRLGFVQVNVQNPIYVIPDLINNIPSVGLPPLTMIKFSKVPGKSLNINMAANPPTVQNPSDWTNGAGVAVQEHFHLVFPANFNTTPPLSCP